MTSNKSYDWQKLKNQYFEKRVCFENMLWNVDTSIIYKIDISRYGTIMAISDLKEPKVIRVYQMNGKEIFNVNFSENGCFFVDFKFYEENLWVILNNFQLRCYNVHGTKEDKYYEFDIMDSTFEIKCQENNAFKNFVINLTNHDIRDNYSELESRILNEFLIIRFSSRFVIVDLIKHISFSVLLNILCGEKINCFEFVKSTDDLYSIIFSYENKIFQFKIDKYFLKYEIITTPFSVASLKSIEASPDNKTFALHGYNRIIYVTDEKFDTFLLEYSLNENDSNVCKIQWCGNHIVTLSLLDEVRLLGYDNNHISFFYDCIDDYEYSKNQKLTSHDLNVPILKSDFNGVKLFTNKKLEYLNRVDDDKLACYQIGSLHPSVMLLECVDRLASDSLKTELNIDSLKSENLLNLALDTCLKVVLDEFDITFQKKHLMAVSFGKIYCNGLYDSEKYLFVLNFVRVLNQIRSQEIGLFLTYNEIKEMGWIYFFNLLLRRNHYLLSLAIIDILDLDEYKDFIYTQWCTDKIKKEKKLNDLDLFQAILEKINHKSKCTDVVSLNKLYEIALNEKRIELYKFFQLNCPFTKLDIKKTINLNEYCFVLHNLIQNGCYDRFKLLFCFISDFVSFETFFESMKQLSNFCLIMSKYNNVLKNLKKPFSENYKLINNNFVYNFLSNFFYLLNNNFIDQIPKNLFDPWPKILNSFSQFETKIESSKYYSNYKKFLIETISQLKDKQKKSFYHLELQVLELQKKLSDDTLINFFKKKSVCSIIKHLIINDKLNYMPKILDKFNVSVTKYWYLIIKMYSESQNYIKLHKFILDNNKFNLPNLKSPVGFKVIIENSFKNKAPNEYITMYIKNSNDITYSEMLDYYVKNSNIDLAIEEAFKKKDVVFLEKVLSKIKDKKYDNCFESIVKNHLKSLNE